MEKNYPCKDCKKRNRGCHDRCEEYQEIHKKDMERYKDNADTLFYRGERLTMRKDRDYDSKSRIRREYEFDKRK